MIDYYRKLSNVRETQVPSQRMSILVLLYKNIKRQFHAVFIVCLFDLILYVPSTIFQLNRDGFSWVEPVLSYDKCVLLEDHNAVTPVRLGPSVSSQALYH